MKHRRYGNLNRLAAKTDSNCHLCHEPIDLTFYGPTGAFGDDTVTVDHLVPQSKGGDDHPSNLLLAHGHCNSARGTGDVEGARLALAGTPDPPTSASEKEMLSLLGGGGVGLLAGHLFATPGEDGKPVFNFWAALLTGAAVATMVRATI